MNIKNCPRCGRLFPDTGKPYCRQCIKADEEEFQKVRKFLHEYPHSTVDETSDATGVPSNTILRFLREGRLLATDGLTGAITCQWCGRPVKSGFHCRSCLEKVQQRIESVLPKEDPESKSSTTGHADDKMYISDMIRDRRR